MSILCAQFHPIQLSLHSFRPLSTATVQNVVESRWRRLRRERREAPAPKHRTSPTFARDTFYTVEEALGHVRKSSWARFDETVEAVFRLNIDPRRVEQNIRVQARLPHGHGRDVQVAVFAEDEEAVRAKEAGASVVGAAELIEQVKSTKGRVLKGCEVALAVPELVPAIASQVGKVLGPKGLMPSAKKGTATGDVVGALKAFKFGDMSFKTDKDGNVHCVVGKLSFKDDMLRENLLTVAQAIQAARPASVKKKYMNKAFLASAMGPAVRLDVQALAADVRKFTMAESEAQ